MKVIQAVLFTDNDFIKFFSCRRKGNLANLLVLHVSDACIKIFSSPLKMPCFFFLTVVNVFFRYSKKDQLQLGNRCNYNHRSLSII